MWLRIATKKELPDIFDTGQKTSIKTSELSRSVPALLRATEIAVVWREDPMQVRALPAAVLVHQDQFQDFLAWAATFLPIVSPFTAHCRVLTPNTGSVLEERRQASLGALEDACLGLILGEAATYLEGKLDLKQLSPSICARTYSFALSRALALGILNIKYDPVSTAWFALRAVTKQPQLNLDVHELQEPWAVLLSLDAGGLSITHPLMQRMPPGIVESCMDLHRTGDIGLESWRKLTEPFPEIAQSKEEMLGSREERVSSFERSMLYLRAFAEREKRVAAFICGYFASQISPGTFDHGMLVAPHVKILSSALLWFGLCAGLRNQSALQRNPPGLGRRILREVLRSESLLDLPRCDISLAELEVLSKGDGPITLRPAVQGHLEVEIAPCVNSYIRWPSRPAELQESTTSPAQPEVRRVLAELDHAVGRIDEVQQNLVRLLIPNETPSSSKSRRRKRTQS